MRKNRCFDVFEDRVVIPPSTFSVENYRRDPVAVFNPGAVLVGDEIHVFPRLIFDYYKYTSAIGHFILGLDEIEEMFSGRIPSTISVEIVLWPSGKEEFLGCEDPRVVYRDGEFWMLYTAKGFSGRGEQNRVDRLGLAVFNGDLTLSFKEYIPVRMGKSTFFPKSNKDSAFLEFESNRVHILTRPEIGEILQGWKGVLNLEEMILEDLEPVLPPNWWELKTGWSTNAVKIDQGYLIGWHAVIDEDLSYRNGLALVNSEGKLLKISDYVLCPKGLEEEYGDRALVIFGDGLLLYGDHLIWIGGVSDYAIGIFRADLKRALETLNEI